MHHQKQNYVALSYQMSKGLNFKWNFKDLFQYTTFFHHLFIIRSHHPETIIAFIAAYFKKIKSGDLISVIYFNGKKKEVCQVKWIQKSQINTFDFATLTKKLSSYPLNEQTKQSLTKMSIKESMGKNQHYIVNFILEDQMQEKQLQLKEIIKKGRNEGGFTHLCSFFGNYQANHISFDQGINFFSFDPSDWVSLLNFFHIHINNAIIKNACISVECTNGQLVQMHNRVWKSVDFNKLEKMFYGASVSYIEDQLHFYVTQANINFEFEIVISLEMTMFSGQVLKSIKKVILSVPSQKYLNRSINMAYYDAKMYVEGITLANNPYSTLSVARLIKN